jgi:ATP-binding cassette subfamily B protein
MTFFKTLKWYFKIYWPAYVLAILFIIAVRVLGVIPPKIIGDTIDRMSMGSLTGGSLLRTIGLLALLALATFATTYLWINTLMVNSIRIEKLLRSRLLRHISKMTPRFFQRNSRGELMALATNDILAISQTAGFGVQTLAQTVIGASVVVATMVTLISYKLMLAALLPMPFLALAIRVLGKHMRVRFVQAQAAFGRMNDQALESISGIRVIRSYVQEKADVEAFQRVTTDVLDKNRAVAQIQALFQPTISTLVGLSFAIGLGYGSYLVMNGEITLGQLVSFNIYLGLLIWPMIAFGEFINIIQRGNASSERLQRALDQTPDVKEPEQPVEVERPESIEVRHLTFRYPDAAQDSLRDISFRLERGQTLGIVGRTGSGKSTLLKQLLLQYPASGEAVRISGVPIRDIAPDRLKQWIGYVPQEHLLLSKSIKANLKLGKPAATDEEIQLAVEQASLAQDIAQMPDGIDTLIGENGVMLSGGQKQRLAIARALVIDPEILILDDALSAVDARTEAAILRRIREGRAGRTTLIATHRLSAVSHANWIIVLDEGRIVEQGTHEQLMALGGWYREQYDRQQLEASLQEGGDRE